MSIFGEGRVQCMKVSKKMPYVGQKTHNWCTGPTTTHHNILTCIQRLDSANVLSLALDSATDCRMHCSQLPICIVITIARPAMKSRFWCSTQDIGFVNMSTTATRQVVAAAKHNQYSRYMWEISEHLKKYVQYVLWGRGGQKSNPNDNISSQRWCCQNIMFTAPFLTQYFHFICWSSAAKINRSCIKCNV
jgi:hypothetical protein